MQFVQINEGHTYSVEFLVGRPYRRSHKGKHWPVTTQCIIRDNGLVIGIGEAVKHELETHNPHYGRVKAAKKAFENSKLNGKIWRGIRENFWKEILKNK